MRWEEEGAQRDSRSCHCLRGWSGWSQGMKRTERGEVTTTGEVGVAARQVRRDVAATEKPATYFI